MNIDQYINKYAMASMTTLRRAAGRMYKGRKIYSLDNDPGTAMMIDPTAFLSKKPLIMLAGSAKTSAPTTAHHEFAEARAALKTLKSKGRIRRTKFQKDNQHMDPSVLLNEHNILTTLPKKNRRSLRGQSKKDYKEADETKLIRQGTGEANILERKIRQTQPNFTFGESPRLNRREVEHYTKSIGKGYRSRHRESSIPYGSAKSTQFNNLQEQQVNDFYMSKFRLMRQPNSKRYKKIMQRKDTIRRLFEKDLKAKQ